MKVLIGVCGIGRGHSMRQYEIASALASRGHEVQVLTFGRGAEYFQNTRFPYRYIWVPMVICRGDKLDYRAIIRHNWRAFIPGIAGNEKVFRELERSGFVPDLCISDYEPVTARFAYRWNKPLVIIDQQGMFMLTTYPDIAGYSCKEEHIRQRLFFPKFHRRYVATFMNLDERQCDNIYVVPPIIGTDVREIVRNPRPVGGSTLKVIVYLSEYIDKDASSRRQLLDVLERLTDVQFIFFTAEHYETDAPNITVKPFDRTSFLRELADSDAVLSTAGYTLMSEALYLQLPMYVMPLPYYEQHYNAEFLQGNRIGYASGQLSYKELVEFLSQLPLYKRNIKSGAELLLGPDPVQRIVDELEREYA